MESQEVLSHPPLLLKQEQREFYFENGYLLLENFVDKSILKSLNEVTHNFTEKSRVVAQSNNIFDVAPEHSKDKPVVRRIKRPDEQHKTYWDFTCGLMADLAQDLAGPDVTFHHSKLNFKWFDESDKVQWHQDIPFFPHTNYNVFTIGCYLEDTDMTNGPVAVLPGSHNTVVYDHYDKKGNWLGAINEDNIKEIDTSKVKYLTGRAGSITIHNSRTIHSSPASKSRRPRPVLLNCYSSADAKPYTPHPDPSINANTIVRGERALWAHHDPRPCRIPPDWSGGYTSIYAAQAGEDK